MSFSLNEIEATAKRATRGAGYDWGLAEEGSKAARWLCAQGIDGAQVLAQLLERGLAEAPPARVSPDRTWAGEGVVCPLRTGAFLSDCAAMLRAGPIHIRQVASPELLLPFAAHAARQLNATITLQSGVVVAVTDGSRLAMAGDHSDPTGDVTVSVGGTLTDIRPHHSRATPDVAGWATLNRFAHRTFAPATEASRLLGAGAGVSDND